MGRDCYDKDKKNLIANVKGNILVNEKSKFIIDKYKTKPSKSLKEFIDFHKNKDQLHYKDKLLKLKLFFWRFHNPIKADPKIYSSCVPNGTCGFQMEHLLREKKEHVIPG